MVLCFLRVKILPRGPRARADLTVSPRQTSTEQHACSGDVSSGQAFPGLTPIPAVRIAPPPTNTGRPLTVHGVFPHAILLGTGKGQKAFQNGGPQRGTEVVG